MKTERMVQDGSKHTMAIAHEWFQTPAGSEECVRSFLNVWNDADLFSVVDFFSQENRDMYLRGKHATTTFVQNLPFARRSFRNFLSLLPYAVEQLDLSAYDIVLSSAHAVIKGIITKANQLHICYCHTPMRYAWDLYHQYIKEGELDSGMKGFIARRMLHKIRIWDATTTNRVDYFIANSRFTASRIKKIYGKTADVIYPPVDVDTFACHERKEDYYITVSRFVPYKKVDVVVEAFSAMPDKKLLVIGDGPEEEKIKAKAGKNIELLGYLPPAELKNYLQRAKAFVFAAEEDFGIVVIEAMACGTPVIALRKGGAAETVRHGATGIHFLTQTPDAICEAVKEFETGPQLATPAEISAYASSFSRPRFEREIREYVESKADAFFQSPL